MPGKVDTGFPSGIATKNNYSSELTGGIAFAGDCGATEGGALAGFSITGAGNACGTACTGSTVPAACCGADAGRLRGTGGWLGMTAADFAGFACVAGGKPACGGWPSGAITEPGGAIASSSGIP